MTDDAHGLRVISHERPRSTGPGSRRQDWQAYASAVEDANVGLQQIIRDQDATIAMLTKELEQARREIAKRTPKSGRQRLPEETVRRIKAALENGGGVRAVAKSLHVSAMTVSRYKRAMEATSAE